MRNIKEQITARPMKIDNEWRVLVNIYDEEVMVGHSDELGFAIFEDFETEENAQKWIDKNIEEIRNLHMK